MFSTSTNNFSLIILGNIDFQVNRFLNAPEAKDRCSFETHQQTINKAKNKTVFETLSLQNDRENNKYVKCK